MLPVLRTAYEMLSDRGYVPRKNMQYSEDEKNLQRISQTNVVTIADRKQSELHTKDSIMVFIAFQLKLGVATTREFTEKMEEEDIKHGLLICAEKPSHKAFEELQKAGVEIFTALELFKNITRHSLVPKHRQLSSKEVEALKKKLGAQLNDFPVYSNLDPVVRYYGWPIGTVVEIQRAFGGTREGEVYYRVVKDINIY